MRDGKLIVAVRQLARGSSSTVEKDNVQRETYYIGGQYVGPPEARVMQGQMYVEVLSPEVVRHAYPLVFVHGTGQTAVNWLTTPDGRPGWADWFIARGWRVILVDQPARGRSAWQGAHDGELSTWPVNFVESLFTAGADGNRWPQAKLHTQWPGGPNKGHAGDAVFDQFYASQVPSMASGASETALRAAGAALLDRVGPAILVGHSQGGMLNWLIADERPELVKAIVAIEPSGPPYKDVRPGAADRVWGLTSSPLAYDPAATANDPLRFEQQPAVRADRVPGWLQKAPARRLAHLSAIPVLLITAEASYHAPFDHCTVDYLRQAGVTVDYLRLEEHGIHGNGHMMMLELNHEAIAGLIDDWLGKRPALSRQPADLL